MIVFPIFCLLLQNIGNFFLSLSFKKFEKEKKADLNRKMNKIAFSKLLKQQKSEEKRTRSVFKTRTLLTVEMQTKCKKTNHCQNSCQ